MKRQHINETARNFVFMQTLINVAKNSTMRTAERLRDVTRAISGSSIFTFGNLLLMKNPYEQIELEE